LHFTGLESPGKGLLVLKTSANILNSSNSSCNFHCIAFPGGLVRKILETKKELEGSGNQEARPKQVSLNVNAFGSRLLGM